jgi:hypothetical protein
MLASLAKSLSTRDRRALKWGLGIAAAAVAFAFVVKPYIRALRETRDELAVQLGLLAREREVINASSKLPTALQASQTALDQQSQPLFDAPDELSATSDLSDKITEAAVANRVLIQQVETRKAEALSDGVVGLAVDVRAEGDFEGVMRFLNSLERGDKLIRVSSLTLTRVDRPATNGVQGVEVVSIAGTFTGYGAFSPSTDQSGDQDGEKNGGQP